MEKFNKMIALADSFPSRMKRYKKALFAFLKAKRDRIRANTASASRLIPAVARKPSVIWRWLLASSWFYLGVIMALILMKTAVPWTVDATLGTIYPQIETKRMFGLIVQKSDDPRIIWQRKIILGLFWAGAFGLNTYVLLLCLPGTVRKADIKARQKEAMADKMVALKPSESILLYTEALKLAVDQTHESILTSKIDTLDDVMKSGRIELEPSMPPTSPKQPETGTIVLPQDRSGPSEQGDAIGPDGRYRIESKLGQGAMGIVHLANDQLLLRNVALKKLTCGQNQDQNLINRFQQEARALAQLSHPNIVQIYDFVQEADQYWIAMEYVAGKDLAGLIGDSATYPLKDSLRICCLIADAMDYAHHRGVVHRDFKPSNVLITTSGEPKVMDFGLAKLAHSDMATMEGSLLGSPAFMSPEQARGEPAGARSDIYALGVTLYQLTTGRLPFEGGLKSVLTQKIAGREPSLEPLETRLPAELVQIIKKMIATDPDERPATMKAVGQALQTINETVV